MSSKQPRYPTVVVQRVPSNQAPDTTELKELATAAGCTVVGEITQERAADPEFEIGSGKVEELIDVVTQTGATNVIFDGRLSPFQTYNIAVELPDGVDVIDRFLLVLRAFEHRADSHREQLQVQLASLRYELPRLDAKMLLSKRERQPECMQLDAYDESYETSVKDRISALKDELDHFELTNRDRRETQREDGFNLVSIAGYANSGKSTLFKRLAADLTVPPQSEAPQNTTVVTAKTPLTTFEPTTRRMPHTRRDILLTDTLGVLTDIPHWIYDSLSSSLAPLADSEVIIITVDSTDPTPVMRKKLTTVQDILRTETTAPTITAFTKSDEVPHQELQAKVNALTTSDSHTVVTSAIENTGIDALKHEIDVCLPELIEERLQLPLTDNTMGVVSWIHDNTNVISQNYGNDTVVLAFEADPAIVKQARAKATTVVPSG